MATTKSRIATLHSPVGGLRRQNAYQHQEPYTTPDCANVRPRDVLEGRGRIGSRPGLAKAYETPLGSVVATGTITAAAPIYTEETATSAIIDNAGTSPFLDSYVGASIRFDTSGKLYVITAVADSTHATVSGDASGESSSDTYGIITGDPIRMLATVRVARPVTDGSFEDDFDELDHLDPLSDDADWSAITGATQDLIQYDGYHDKSVTYVFPKLTESDRSECLWANASQAVANLDTSKAHTVRVRAEQTWSGATYGGVDIWNIVYIGLADISPDTTNSYVWVKWIKDSTYWVHRLYIYEHRNGADTQIGYYTTGTIQYIQELWLSRKGSAIICTVKLSDSTMQNVSMSGGLSGELSGTRAGIGAYINGYSMTTDFTELGLQINEYEYTYHTLPTTKRNTLVASAGGKVFYTNAEDRFVDATIDETYLLASDRNLQAVDRAGTLYIADTEDEGILIEGTTGVVTNGTLDDSTPINDWDQYGISIYKHIVQILTSDDEVNVPPGDYAITAIDATSGLTLETIGGVGAADASVTYQVVRCPKKLYITAATPALEMWYADAGKQYIPKDCPCIARHLDRIYLAGDPVNPTVWYGCRRSNPGDWDYAPADLTSAARAVGGVASDAGRMASPITALIPGSDDYMLIACENSLWRMLGDPAYGGQIHDLSKLIGATDKTAWCNGPEGQIIFLSRGGIYELLPGAGAFPQAVSRAVLPKELMDIDPSVYQVTLEYDTVDTGVHIYLSAITGASAWHWWVRWDNHSFWPVTLTSDHDPMATCLYQDIGSGQSDVLLGCRDGYIRHYLDTATDDDGESFTSYAVYGPFPLSTPMRHGLVHHMTATLDEDGGSVDWELRGAKNAERAINNPDIVDSGTWVAGSNYWAYPIVSGSAGSLKVSAAGVQWAIEGVAIHINDAGMQRM